LLCSGAGKWYQRVKLKQTAAALNGVPSENLTPLRSAKVQIRWFLLTFQPVARLGAGMLVPVLKPTRLSKICPVGRSDSPSELSDGSSDAGSVEAP
jgi:hypothetical protein